MPDAPSIAIEAANLAGLLPETPMRTGDRGVIAFSSPFVGQLPWEFQGPNAAELQAIAADFATTLQTWRAQHVNRRAELEASGTIDAAPAEEWILARLELYDPLVWYDGGDVFGGGQRVRYFVRYRVIENPWPAILLIGGLLLVVGTVATSAFVNASIDKIVKAEEGSPAADFFGGAGDALEGVGLALPIAAAAFLVLVLK